MTSILTFVDSPGVLTLLGGALACIQPMGFVLGLAWWRSKKSDPATTTTEKRQHSNPYIAAGDKLACSLATSLGLEGWQTSLPPYTQEENEAIALKLSSFQAIANQTMGGNAKFHPEIADQLQRSLTAEALEDLAGGWERGAAEVPQDWKIRVATYLKAWACNLNPGVLQEMAELLGLAGRFSEAKQALEVVLLFPTYSSAYCEGSTSDKEFEMTKLVVENATKTLDDLANWVRSGSTTSSSAPSSGINAIPSSLHGGAPSGEPANDDYPALSNRKEVSPSEVFEVFSRELEIALSDAGGIEKDLAVGNRAHPRPESSRDGLLSQTRDTGSARVLIAEDEEQIREVIAAILTSEGYQCETAADGLQALTMLDSGGGKFDLLLTGLMMRNLDGLGLLERTKKQFPDLPVIMQTSINDPSVRSAAMKAGAESYLLHPFDRDELSRAVHGALEKRDLKLQNHRLGLPEKVPKVDTQILTSPRSSVEFRRDGRVIISSFKGAGITDFRAATNLVFLHTVQSELLAVAAKTRSFRKSLPPDLLSIAAKWVTQVAGKPIRNGVWEEQHEEVFVRGFERFCWDGGIPSPTGYGIPDMHKLCRAAYPILAGSRIDVDLNDEMRRLFARMHGGRSASNSGG